MYKYVHVRIYKQIYVMHTHTDMYKFAYVCAYIYHGIEDWLHIKIMPRHCQNASNDFDCLAIAKSILQAFRKVEKKLTSGL